MNGILSVLVVYIFHSITKHKCSSRINLFKVFISSSVSITVLIRILPVSKDYSSVSLILQSILPPYLQHSQFLDADGVPLHFMLDHAHSLVPDAVIDDQWVHLGEYGKAEKYVPTGEERERGAGGRDLD